MSLEEKHLDVLQNIESMIQFVYKNHRELTDYDVTFALEALIDFFTAKERNREPGKFNLSENSATVYEQVKEICEYRIGNNNTIYGDKMNSSDVISKIDLISCLKKIKKSVVKWTKRNGRQGYLEFVKVFIPNV